MTEATGKGSDGEAWASQLRARIVVPGARGERAEAWTTAKPAISGVPDPEFQSQLKESGWMRTYSIETFTYWYSPRGSSSRPRLQQYAS
jgi:hypothetical protein